ncbi:MAG: hypothetical protein ABIK28_04280 [Planctomycetota bacterium]
MDLTTLWQEHKTFVLSVMAGVLLLFIGQAAVTAIYGIDDSRRQVRSLESSLKKSKTPTPKQMADEKALNQELKTRYEKAVHRISFVPDAKFLLSNTEKPDIQYDRLFNEARDNFVDGAKILNITVDGSLGMPELSPTRRSDIQEALTALDLVTRVVFLAIECHVSDVSSISMVPDSGRKKKSFICEHKVKFKMQGTATALAEFLRRFALQENFLALESAVIEAVDPNSALVKANFTVSAVEISKEEAET